MPRHTPGHTAEPKGHFWKKKNKKKPCCSVRREEEQEAAGPFPHGSVLYSNFPAATRRRTSRSESHPLSPSLQCTLFSVQGLSISHLVLRVLNDNCHYSCLEISESPWTPRHTQTSVWNTNRPGPSLPKGLQFLNKCVTMQNKIKTCWNRK